MPLVRSILKGELVKIMDRESQLFEGFPQSNVEVANRWSTAIKIYSSTILPYSANVELAKQAFELAMLPISPQLSNGMVLFQTAFTNFATQLALGMAPAFTGVPPLIPINLTPVSTIGLSGGTADQCAELMSTIIDAWFRTGYSVLNSPPNGLINWN